MLQAELAARGVHSAALRSTLIVATGTFVTVDGEIRARSRRQCQLPFRSSCLPLEADAALVSGYLPVATVTAALERSDAAWIALAVAHLTHLPDDGNAVFMNEDEARTIAGTGPEEAVQLLAQRYRLVCVTIGASGAIGALDGQLESTAVGGVGRAPSNRPGAGDAFAAAALVALAGGASLPDALADRMPAGALAARP